MIAGFASVLGKQARGTVLLEATQQTKPLTPLQADQHTGVSNTQTTRLNPQQHLKPAELLLAHRQHRHGAPPGTPEPGGVSPLSCRGVSSLYCAYRGKGGKSALWKTRIAPFQGHATMPSFSASSDAVFFELAGSVSFSLFLKRSVKPFNSGQFANRVNQRKRRRENKASTCSRSAFRSDASRFNSATLAVSNPS